MTADCTYIYGEFLYVSLVNRGKHPPSEVSSPHNQADNYNNCCLWCTERTPDPGQAIILSILGPLKPHLGLSVSFKIIH